MSVELGIIFAFIACVIGVATFFIGRQTAAKNEGKAEGSSFTGVLKDIEYMKVDISKILDKLDKLDNNYNQGFKDIKKDVSESVRRLHERIDAHLREDHGFHVPIREE